MGFYLLRGKVRGTVQDKGGTEVPTVAVARLEEPLFDLEVQKVVVIGGFHHFHWRYGRRREFVTVQQNNNNIIHTIPTCKKC